MAENWKNFLFGLFFGMGFMLSYAVLQGIIWLLSKATPVHIP